MGEVFLSEAQGGFTLGITCPPDVCIRIGELVGVVLTDDLASTWGRGLWEQEPELVWEARALSNQNLYEQGPRWAPGGQVRAPG